MMYVILRYVTSLVSASKKYSKPIETGDAYYIKDNELVKIKVVRQS